MKKLFIVLFVLLFSYNMFSAKNICQKYKLKSSYDTMQGIKWYTPKGVGGSWTGEKFYPYIGKSSDSVWLRLKIEYAGKDWLFINKYIVKIGRERFTLIPKNIKRRVSNYGGISEISDMKVDGGIFKLIKKISNAKRVVLRYNGSRGYYDKTLNLKKIRAFKNILNAYRELEGSNGRMLKKKVEEIPIQETKPVKKEIITEPQTVETPKPIIETTKPITNKGITLGMSLLEVRGKLGTPLSRVNEGDRVIYKYKDVVIVFGSKGKVVKIIK